MPASRRFQFGPCLGQGGYGEVYRAYLHAPSGVVRTVAVKLLRTQFKSNTEALQRLRDEARLLGALHHRAVVQVLDLVELHGRLALVTEYVQGADLAVILAEDGSMPHRVALEVVREVASALAAAYDAVPPGGDAPMQLVHRDLKPANVRVSPDGSVKLLDFGIARSPEVDREAQTGTGLIVGTVGYFSPERLTEDDTTSADDVYGLGCVLFELLTGIRLYEGLKRADLFRLSLHPDTHTDFISTQLDAAQTLPSPVRTLLAAMLATEPEARPAARMVEEMCEQLALAVTGPSLRAWARSRTWSEPATVDGELEGQEAQATVVIDGGELPAAQQDTEPEPATTLPPLDAPPRETRAKRRPQPRPVQPPPPPRSSVLPWMLGLAMLVGSGAVWWSLQQPSTAPQVAVDLLPTPDPAVPEPVREAAPAAEPAPAPEPLAEPAPPPEPEPVVLPPSDAPPPSADLHAHRIGDDLVLLRDGRRVSVHPLGSPAESVRSLSDPGPLQAAKDVCARDDTLAIATGAAGLVEVRTLSTDTLIDRMRPGGDRVTRVHCLADGQVVALTETPRSGAGRPAQELVWYDSKGRVKGRLAPRDGVLDVVLEGDTVLIQDRRGALRSWTGVGSPPAEAAVAPGTPTGVAPARSGPPWVLTTTHACAGDRCVALDASRGIAAAGTGWAAVAQNDRIVVIDAVEARILSAWPARAISLGVLDDDRLLVVEPDGARAMHPLTGVSTDLASW